MIEIIPAIMPQNFKDLEEKIEIVKDHSYSIQLDLMDGKFVPEKTWPFIGDSDNTKRADEDKVQRIYAEHVFEFDLMVENASADIPHWANIGASRIIFHVEAEPELLTNLEKFKADLAGIEVGLAFDDDLPIQEIIDSVPYVDFIQCMGIDHIGRQGEPFEPRVLDNLRELRELFPELVLSVDGSVNKDTIKDIVAAGANRVVVGSAVFGVEDPVQAIQDLQKRAVE
jgi:ribulose-phosphate 3-epimerase